MTNEDKNPLPWMDQREAYEEALRYISNRRLGKITSLLTAWNSLNKVTVNGLEWHNTIVIGARPGGGKTLMKDQLIRDLFVLNPLANFQVLEFEFEMLSTVKCLRSLSSETKRTYRDLCSADNPLEKEVFDDCVTHARKKLEFPINIRHTPCTVTRLEEIIHQYMEHHSYLKLVDVKDKEGNISKVQKKTYKGTIVSLDHSNLVRKDKHEKNTLEMLYNLGETITKLKRMYPITFIILSQLNRDIEHPDRCQSGTYGNYVLESDFFGSDALLQHADVLIGVDKPAKRKITEYGPLRYLIDDPNLLAIHYLKVRNGEPGMAFFTAKFDTMEVHERQVEPVKIQRKMRNS